jgi:tetratricopeptide (TPR) repeat protein
MKASHSLISILAYCTVFLFAGAVHEAHSSPFADRATSNWTFQTQPSCADFAQNQIRLADRLLEQSKYTRALKVLNSTARNCDIEEVRSKILETLGKWYTVVRGQDIDALQRFLNVLAEQPHISSAQRNRLEQRVAAQIRGVIEQKYASERFRTSYQLCRRYSRYTSGNFESEYYCGRSAEKVGAVGAAMESYQWLVQNWEAGQSLSTWNETAGRLEKLYFRNGRFRPAYELARQRARRDPSPRAILSSLVSARGHFLSPVLQTGAIFYEQQPSSPSRSLVETELQKVNFPEYVKALYLLNADGTLQKGLYGTEANEPPAARLESTSGRVSLLKSTGNSNLVWLVSPVEDQYLVLEFGIATTPEENVRLETVYENVNSDTEWQKLYDLEFDETSPATGSAVGTFLSGARTGNENLASYASLFDDSTLLTYYCIQDQTGTVLSSHDFDRADLGYGDSEWQRSSNTPALYHHLIEYAGESIREVVWPRFVDDNWSGVVRVGLARS